MNVQLSDSRIVAVPAGFQSMMPVQPHFYPQPGPQLMQLHVPHLQVVDDFDSLLRVLHDDSASPIEFSGLTYCSQNEQFLTGQSIRADFNDTTDGNFSDFQVLSQPPPTEPRVAVVSPVQGTQKLQVQSPSDLQPKWEQQPPLSPISSAESSSMPESADSLPVSTTCPSMDLDEKVEKMKGVLEGYEKIMQANKSNGKFQVHQVVFLILLASEGKCPGLDLKDVLVFCDEHGKPCSSSGRRHFRAMNTKAMGMIWQKIKGNRNSNYDTFARAMRVGREKERDYFAYLDSGKSSKKRVYQLGKKSIEEMRKLEALLPEIVRTQVTKLAS